MAYNSIIACGGEWFWCPQTTAPGHMETNNHEADDAQSTAADGSGAAQGVVASAADGPAVQTETLLLNPVVYQPPTQPGIMDTWQQRVRKQLCYPPCYPPPWCRPEVCGRIKIAWHGITPA